MGFSGASESSEEESEGDGVWGWFEEVWDGEGGRMGLSGASDRSSSESKTGPLQKECEAARGVLPVIVAADGFEDRGEAVD